MYILKEEEIHEQFGRKMKQDVDRNRKLFLKELSKVQGKCGEL